MHLSVKGHNSLTLLIIHIFLTVSIFFYFSQKITKDENCYVNIKKAFASCKQNIEIVGWIKYTVEDLLAKVN